MHSAQPLFVAAVFCHARTRGWYEDRAPDPGLLDYVRDMTYALEVSARTRDEWAHAIRTGLRCLRAAWLHGGGILHGDLEARTLTFNGPLPDRKHAQSAPVAGPISAGTGSQSQRPAAGTAA